jgi:hypothetical protein
MPPKRGQVKIWQSVHTDMPVNCMVHWCRSLMLTPMRRRKASGSGSVGVVEAGLGRGEVERLRILDCPPDAASIWRNGSLERVWFALLQHLDCRLRFAADECAKLSRNRFKNCQRKNGNIASRDVPLRDSREFLALSHTIVSGSGRSEHCGQSHEDEDSECQCTPVALEVCVSR